MSARIATFELEASCGMARAGTLSLPHGQVRTPAFMPVGTRASVRGLTNRELRDAGTQIILANTYHLWVRPGHERIGRLGGLHRFTGWDGPILTDSGGYQVFSMADRVKLSEEGVEFRSPIDGDLRFLTPELAIEIQETLGVDVAMQLDECLDTGADRDRAAASTDRTTRWLGRLLAARTQPEQTAVFGIVQGGFFEDLRSAHAQELAALDLDGYAVGGLSVGEGAESTESMTLASTRHLSADRVRYLMGVGVGHRPVRLRGAHPGRAARHRVHQRRQADGQGGPIRRGRRAAGPQLQLRDVPHRIAGVPPTSGESRRTTSQTAGEPAQRALSAPLDVAHPRCHRR